MKFDKKKMRRESDFFKALGHPTRLWIVRQLTGGEHCVCEFVDAVGESFPTVSRHLAILKKAGLIKDRREGKAIFYSLCCPCIAGLLECLEDRGKLR